MVTDDEGILCLLDFGLCAKVEPEERQAMTKALAHLLYREFDKLVDAARIEQNPKKRTELVNKAQQMHIKDASWIMTMYPGAHEAMPTCMKGYVWQPDYHERWRELSCK